MITNKILSCDDIITNKLSDVSVSVASELLGARTYTRNFPFYLDTKEIDPEYRPRLAEAFSQKDSASRKIHLFQLHNGVVFGQGAVLTANSALISDSVAEFINNNLAPEGSTASGTSFKVDNFQNLRELQGSSVLVKRPWYRNYGHWLVDLMPILPLLKKNQIDVNNIIFGEVPEGNLKLMMERSAALLYPKANVLFVRDNEVLRCDQLYYVRPVHVPPLFKHPDAISQTVELSQELFPEKSAICHRRIYISRDRTNARRVSNEEELVNVLTANDFVTIYPELLDMSQQMSLFRNAEILIGVKGAAFTNSIFCERDCHIVLLSPPKFVDPFFWDIIAQKGMKFSEIYCKEADGQHNSNASNTDLHVDMNSINALLKLL